MSPNSAIYKPMALVILDGWGVAPPGPGNAIEIANTPFFDSLWAGFPHTQLKASGRAVGLPEGEVGTSEVGHLNIGAGRIVWQDVSKIDQAIDDGSFFKNPALIEAVRRIKDGNCLHLMGLVGGGTVHSSLKHLFALLDLCAQEKLPQEKVKIHVFSDGRDSPPESALNYIQELNEKITEYGVGEIASIMGRFYAMDRDQRWERTERAYRTLTAGEGQKAHSVEEVIQQSYTHGEPDEFIEPTIIEGADGLIRNGDSVIFFNFRADRARQLTRAFVSGSLIDLEFKYFDRGPQLENLFFVSLVEYEKAVPVSASAFIPHNIKANLAQLISQQSKTQFHIAESEKYAYVTYYFNGGIEPPLPGEDRLVIPSPKVLTYDKAPEMAAMEIAAAVKERILGHNYDFFLINFANADMLGHTGIIPAAIKGVEAVDEALKIVVNAILEKGGACIITADHGNAEEMLDPITGEISTSHSNNRVPLIVVGQRDHFRLRELQSGILADIAPTILELMGIPKPSLMTGRCLL